jgi:hypothetical protein
MFAAANSIRIAALLWLLAAAPALANVEKAIFFAPEAISIPKTHPNLDDLFIQPLSHSKPFLRTRLNASFPTDVSLKGTESWFLLQDLNPNQRYEVRICWLATVRFLLLF